MYINSLSKVLSKHNRYEYYEYRVDRIVRSNAWRRAFFDGSATKTESFLRWQRHKNGELSPMAAPQKRKAFSDGSATKTESFLPWQRHKNGKLSSMAAPQKRKAFSDGSATKNYSEAVISVHCISIFFKKAVNLDTIR
jgi:hypothetical protein